MEKNEGVTNFYRLQDGTQADPKDCEAGKDGVLRHKVSGLTVAMTADGKPETIADAAESSGNAAAARAGKPVGASTVAEVMNTTTMTRETRGE